MKNRNRYLSLVEEQATRATYNFSTVKGFKTSDLDKMDAALSRKGIPVGVDYNKYIISVPSQYSKDVDAYTSMLSITGFYMYEESKKTSEVEKTNILDVVEEFFDSNKKLFNFEESKEDKMQAIYNFTQSILATEGISLSKVVEEAKNMDSTTTTDDMYPDENAILSSIYTYLLENRDTVESLFEDFSDLYDKTDKSTLSGIEKLIKFGVEQLSLLDVELIDIL